MNNLYPKHNAREEDSDRTWQLGEEQGSLRGWGPVSAWRVVENEVRAGARASRQGKAIHDPVSHGRDLRFHSERDGSYWRSSYKSDLIFTF